MCVSISCKMVFKIRNITFTTELPIQFSPLQWVQVVFQPDYFICWLVPIKVPELHLACLLCVSIFVILDGLGEI